MDYGKHARKSYVLRCNYVVAFYYVITDINSFIIRKISKMVLFLNLLSRVHRNLTI